MCRMWSFPTEADMIRKDSFSFRLLHVLVRYTIFNKRVSTDTWAALYYLFAYTSKRLKNYVLEKQISQKALF